jgi:hypothetical protein
MGITASKDYGIDSGIKESSLTETSGFRDVAVDGQWGSKEHLELAPGKETIISRVNSLISKGEVHKAVDVLQKGLMQQPTEALTNFAEDILDEMQRRLPHEKTLQSTLQNAIGLGVEALNPERQKSVPANNALPELRKAA